MGDGLDVLVLSGDASMTGTPRLLLSWLRHLRRLGGSDVRLVLDAGGPLLDALQSVSEVRVTAPTDPSAGRPRARVLELARLAAAELHAERAARLAEVADRRWSLRRTPRPDVVVANGAGALRWLDALPRPVPPTVAVVHEMAVGLDRSLAGLDGGELLRRPDRVIAVSDPVAVELTARGVPRHRITVATPWPPDEAVGAGAGTAPLRASLGVDGGSSLVVACGTAGWRKGTDLLLSVAQQLDDGTHLAWIGDLGTPIDRSDLEREIRARGLAGRFHLVDQTADAARLLGQADAFALTSREDPFPLVVLEAGLAEVPVVTFESGGAASLLRGAGLGDLVAEPLDVRGFAARVRWLLEDEGRRREAGRRLAAHVRREHDPEVGARTWWEIVRAAAR